jgi:DNA-binding transcriptional regulator LsrR (DeoR family)
MLRRIGDKIINPQKIHKIIDEILEMRGRGMSQQDIANKVGLDRTVISRLETYGEVRKGGRIALIGFPIKNCDELAAMARQEGVDYCLLLTEKERWDFVESKSGLELFNTIMEIIGTLRSYDMVIIICSNMRIKLIEALLDKDVIGVQLGESPINEDKYVKAESIREIIRQLHF